MPIILNGDGSPWAEGNLYILSRLESDLNFNISTYHCIADDLASYRKYLEDEGLDFKLFPRHKYQKPTYRYRGALNHKILSQDIALRTAQRKMGSVIQFYRWLIYEGLLKPEYPPWKEHDTLVRFNNSQGFSIYKQNKSTDLGFHTSTQKDPYDNQINDMGKLRPLNHGEQKALIESLSELGNYQMTLIHLLALFTGGRIQTILTLRVYHVRFDLPDDVSEIRFPVGSGTNVDSKHNKQISIFIPRWLYEKLRTYSFSKETQKRRKKSGNISDSQYLFISNQGNPLYTSKHDQTKIHIENNSRYINNGQNVRQFISRRVIPLMRKKLGNPSFKYKFHDLRASYGMNITENQLKLVQNSKATLQQACEFKKAKKGNQSQEILKIILQYIEYTHI